MEKVLQELFGHIFWVPIPFKPYQITSGCGTASRDSEIKGAIVRFKNTNAIAKRPVNKLFLIQYTYHDKNQTDKARKQKLRKVRNSCNW